MLAVGGNPITDVRKPRNHGYDVIAGGELLPITPITLANLSRETQTQINRRRTLPASSRWRTFTASSLAWKTSLRKVRTLWHCSRLRSVALYLWLIVVTTVRQSTVAAISGLRPGAGYGQFEHKAGSLTKNQRSGRNGQRDWCMSRAASIISALVICIIVCLSWAVNHYRDNAITYKKPSATKMPENWSWRTRQLLTCRCVSVMLLRSMQIQQGVSWC